MKIVTKYGNLLDVSEGHIVHGCNAQGVMGSGVALAVKEKWPNVFDDYRSRHLNDELIVGSAYPVDITEQLIVWNAITQNFYGSGTRQVSYDGIEKCFSCINTVVNNLDTVKKEIHIPLIGAGLGGGNWEIIREIIEQTVTVPTTLWILP